MAATKKPKTQIYEGILYKQGKFNKSWKERFFVLYSDCTLAYFKSEKAWDQGKPEISHIDLSNVRSIAPVPKKDTPSHSDQTKTDKKKKKSRRGSLSRKWSIDFGALFGGGNNEDKESDDEKDGEIAFIELALDQQFTFEIVQAKRTYSLCTNNAKNFNKWLHKLEVTTFGKKVYKGWLMKQSERNKRWEKRWFIIYDSKELRYYDDASRAVSRGVAVLSELKKITKVDDEKAKKKYKQSSVLKLEFKQRTLLLSCSPSDDRRIWFDKMCRLGGDTVHYVDPVYDDYLYRFDDKTGKWKKYWFLLDQHSLYQFRDMDYSDDYCKSGYFDPKEHDKAFKKYVMEQISLKPFDPKNVQKIRPGSKLQTKLVKECLFIIHSKDLGKLFFATQQQSQLNRWFKKIRSLAGDHGRKQSKATISVMSESVMSEALSNDNNPGKQIKIGRTKNQNKILRMLKELQGDIGDCKKDIRFIKDCWDKNNESSEEDEQDDAKYDDDDDDDEY
eukprot:70722_1